VTVAWVSEDVDVVAHRSYTYSISVCLAARGNGHASVVANRGIWALRG
jgi:hypothetical protein